MPFRMIPGVEERAYLDYINGRWELYIYHEDGMYIAKSNTRDDLVSYGEKHGYKIIDIRGK